MSSPIRSFLEEQKQAKTNNAKASELANRQGVPQAMLAHLKQSDMAKFDPAMPPEALAPAALERGMLGQSIPLPHREQCEKAMGKDLGFVQCFSGPEAAEACAMTGTTAFAVKNVIVFGTAEPSYETVMHELVHCFQQGGKDGGGPGGQVGMGKPGDAAEQEAEQTGSELASGQQAGGAGAIKHRSGASLQGFFYLGGDKKTDPAQTTTQEGPRGKTDAETMTAVQNTISDPPYGWTSKYDVTISAKEVRIGLKFKLVAQTGVTEDNVKDRASRSPTAFAKYFDNKFILTDGSTELPLRVGATHVESGEHHSVKLHAGTGRANMSNWYVDDQDIVTAHEMGHMLGLLDEYIDTGSTNRSSATAPGVKQDNSLMGNFWAEGVNTAEVKQRQAEVITGHINTATGRKFTVKKRGK